RLDGQRHVGDPPPGQCTRGAPRPRRAYAPMKESEVLKSRAVTDDQRALDEGVAGRLLLVTDVDLPGTVRQACADLAAALATHARMPVTVAAVPISRLDALEHALRRDAEAQRGEYAPAARRDPAAPMTAAPFLWRPDGRPDWRGMWTTFCELALYGGPPAPPPPTPPPPPPP